MTIPPWHLWGSTETVRQDVVAGAILSTTQQLCRIAYKRPETWKFFFCARLLQNTALVGNIDVLFNVTIGVGRSQVTIPGFEHYIFVLPIALIAMPFSIYSNQVAGPQRTSSDPVSLVNNPLNNVVAQNIQVDAVVSSGGLLAGTGFSMEVSSFWSPESHQRPDWFIRQFAGGELDGH